MSRNRVVGDRLWDDEGMVWTCPLGSWASPEQTRAFLGRGRRVFVHGVGLPARWLEGSEAATWWRAHADHFEVPGTDREARPDEEGRTFAAKIYRDGDARLLAIQVFC